ncbi:MAG: HEAT repeat domain-containing protein [Planctomycetota bacterium]|nr:HEAT repeat domain-containing protein [Planctomycetota bacterium]
MRFELPLAVLLVVGAVVALVAMGIEPPRADAPTAASALPAPSPEVGPSPTARRVALVERLLRLGSPSERTQAATLLATLPLSEAELLPLALRLLSDPLPGVRRDAARALLIVDRLSTEGVAHLALLLEDPDEAVRSLAAMGLARKEARGHTQVVDALLFATRDPVQDVRWVVLESLATHYTSRPAAILEAWVAGLLDPCDDVKSIAANCLEGIGPAARSAAEALEDAMLRTRDPWLEWEISDALNAALGR